MKKQNYFGNIVNSVKETGKAIARAPGKFALGTLVFFTGCGVTSKAGLENKVPNEPKLEMSYLMKSPRFDREYIESKGKVYFVDASVNPYLREMANGGKNTIDLGNGKKLVRASYGPMSDDVKSEYQKLILKADKNGDRAVTPREYRALENSMNK